MAQITAAMVKELRERTGLGMMDCKKALTENDGDMEKAIEALRKSSGMKAAKKAGRTAADGLVRARVADDGSYGVVVEINSETDFAAKNEEFIAFADLALERAFEKKTDDVAALDLEAQREALVQKIGENCSVASDLAAGGRHGRAQYVHTTQKIGVLVGLDAGTQELAKDVAMHVAAVNPLVLRADDLPSDLLEKERAIYTAQAAESGKPAEIVEKMVEGRMRKFQAENALVDQPFVKDPNVKVGALVKDGGATIQAFVRLEVGEGIEKEETDFAAEVAAQAAAADNG